MQPPESSNQSAQQESAQVRQLFDAVVNLAPAERGARLAKEQDVAVRGEVEALLAAYERADEVLRALEEPRPSGDALDDVSASASAGASRDPLLYRRVTHYEILERLGGGGMGVVYRAWDTRLDRPVALKFLPLHLSMDERAKRRLTAEAKAASLLDHPNVATVHEIGEAAPVAGEPGGRLFIVMTCYDGETLKKKVARGPLPIEEAIGYAQQIAEGLDRAHEAGIAHSDIKPANVMVTRRGWVKIVDFGLAKIAGSERTRAGVTLGTVAYMSPEQTHGEAVDHRTDLWSLGVVLYEMLTGERPFRGASERAVVYAILREEPEPVTALRQEVPAMLAPLVEKLLRKDPSARYQQAEALLADLRALQRALQSERDAS